MTRLALVLVLAVWPATVAAEAWYALVPPVIAGHVDLSAPTWDQLRAFDSAEACERTVIEYARQLAAAADAFYGQVQYVRCINVADPRLHAPTTKETP